MLQTARNRRTAEGPNGGVDAGRKSGRQGRKRWLVFTAFATQKRASRKRKPNRRNGKRVYMPICCSICTICDIINTHRVCSFLFQLSIFDTHLFGHIHCVWTTTKHIRKWDRSRRLGTRIARYLIQILIILRYFTLSVHYQGTEVLSRNAKCDILKNDSIKFV